MEAAAAEAGEWPERVRAALAAFLDYCAAEPRPRPHLPRRVGDRRTGRDGALRAGPDRPSSPLFREGRELRGGAGELPDDLEDLIIGGIVWMVHQRLLRNEIDEIPGLLPTMLEFALVPYLGEERAAEVIAAQP